jgi:hypothetical protein
VVATGERFESPTPGVVDGRLGLLLGGADVGDAQGFSVGVSASGGYRYGDVSVRGLFDYYKVGDGADAVMPRHGRGTRVGAAARYSFANNGPESHFRADFWGELGGGWEHIAWLRGGVLDRPSVEAAVGFDVGHRTDADARGHRREIGYFMAFRTLIGEAPEMAGVKATCAGPCTQATTPTRTDVSMFFELGLHWGR